MISNWRNTSLGQQQYIYYSHRVLIQLAPSINGILTQSQHGLIIGTGLELMTEQAWYIKRIIPGFPMTNINAVDQGLVPTLTSFKDLTLELWNK